MTYPSLLEGGKWLTEKQQDFKQSNWNTHNFLLEHKVVQSQCKAPKKNRKLTKRHEPTWFVTTACACSCYSFPLQVVRIARGEKDILQSTASVATTRRIIALVTLAVIHTKPKCGINYVLHAAADLRETMIPSLLRILSIPAHRQKEPVLQSRSPSLSPSQNPSQNPSQKQWLSWEVEVVAALAMVLAAALIVHALVMEKAVVLDAAKPLQVQLPNRTVTSLKMLHRNPLPHHESIHTRGKELVGHSRTITV